MEGEFELVALSNGVQSLRSRRNGQTFHPVVGPAAEAKAIHLAGTRLFERANAQVGGTFTIWDVGLGAAANAVAAMDGLRAGYVGASDLRLLSFDVSLGALDFAVANAEKLEYPAAYRRELMALRRDGTAGVLIATGAGRLRWQLHLADFPALLAGATELPAPDAIFFDPYSPAVNPEMWTLDLFAALHARLRSAVPCLLTTYTRSTAVRVTLLLAGFYVGLGHATGEKDETTIASNDSSLLQRPLGRHWLENKVYASTNAAPLRAGTHPLVQAPIGEADYEQLKAHPQFR